MKKYFEIVKYGDPEEISRRFEVTNESQHNIDRIERGANINLNHNDYFTRVVESETELPEIR